MAFLKETLGITFVAGILAAGVTTYIPKWSAEPAEEPARVAAPSGRAVPTGGVPTTARPAPATPAQPEWVAMPAKPGAPVGGPVAPPSMVAAIEPAEPLPVLASLPAEIRSEAVDRTLDGGRLRASVPVDGSGKWSPAPDPRWTPTPQPEMMAKAEASFDDGDVAGARLWLEAALDKGDAEAAFRLAETYDPAALTRWRIVGMASDPARAKALYERAMNGGVEAARQRVARLGE